MRKFLKFFAVSAAVLAVFCICSAVTHGDELAEAVSGGIAPVISAGASLAAVLIGLGLIIKLL